MPALSPIRVPTIMRPKTRSHTNLHTTYLQGGYYSSYSAFDAFGMSSVADNVYSIPAFRAQYQHACCNVPPRTTVR